MGAGPSIPHDVWVTPGSFDLESSTAFVEPGTPLIAMVVFELEFFVAPDERSTSLRPDRGLKTRKQGPYKQKKTYGSGQVSQLPVPVPPDIDEEED